jgi:hypothetical protein
MIEAGKTKEKSKKWREARSAAGRRRWKAKRTEEKRREGRSKSHVISVYHQGTRFIFLPSV